MASSFRIGSRASRLALFQAEKVAAELRRAHGLDEDAIAIETLSTQGDKIVDTPLWEMGGKGLFTEQIEARLLAREIDFAVHSLKDMPTKPTEGLRADIMLARDDPRDMLILAPSHAGKDISIDTLEPSCRVGSCAPRRMGQLLWLRPDLNVVSVRGNVETRLAKLESGEFDAILLACAGLQRLGIKPPASAILSTETMLPAAGQGVIVVQYRDGDTATQEFLAPVHDWETGICVAAEKSFLATLDGSCTTPAGALATLKDGRIHFRGRLLSMDGKEFREAEEQGDASSIEDAVATGQRAGESLLRQSPQQRPANRCS